MTIRSLLLASLLVPALASAQPSESTRPARERMRSGAAGGAVINTHQGEFAAYDGILECGIFDQSTTLGWQAGYLLDIPFSASLGLSTRLAHWKADGDFIAPNPSDVRVSVDDLTTVPLITEHALETSLDYVMLDLLARWNIAGPLYIAAGPSIGLPARAAYEQEERIVSPQGITFQNGEPTRKIIAGNFDQQGTLPTRRAIRFAGTAALGVDIALTDRFTLSPEVSYNYGFTSVLSSFEWKVNGLRAGAGLSYAFGDESRRDTVSAPVSMPQPVMAFDVRNRLADGRQLNYAEITLTEERASDVIPLLPYLFFAPNSSELPARYRRLAGVQGAGFSEENLRDSVLGVYHHVLDIIGGRMRAYPEASITITGCREPLDDTGSGNTLSAARADAVKEYLVSTWNIPAGRIRTASRVLPGTASNRTSADGREENRRAEINSSDPRILAPVTRRFTTRTLEPEAVAVVPAIQFGESIRSWRLTMISGEGRTLWQTEGTGQPGADILWNVREDALAGGTGNITAKLEATTAEGEMIRAERPVPVRTVIRSRRYNGEVVRDSLIERYNLIFFDFDTPRISDFNQQVVGLIQSRMRTNSAVSITGLTDRVGEESHNQTLSEQRAASSAEQIRSRIVPERIQSAGAGERLIYDNDLPEGRMYNRSVIIEIATPQE